NVFLLVIVLLMWLRKAVSRGQPEWPGGFPGGGPGPSTSRGGAGGAGAERRAAFPGVLPARSPARVGAENARRNPQRTASTAAALMIGLALVTLVATLAAGISSSFHDAVNELFPGDYAITAQNNFSPIPVDAAEAAAQTPGVIAVGNVRTGEALVYKK